MNADQSNATVSSKCVPDEVSVQLQTLENNGELDVQIHPSDSTSHPALEATKRQLNNFAVVVNRLWDLPEIGIQFLFSLLNPSRAPDIRFSDSDVCKPLPDLVEALESKGRMPELFTGWNFNDAHSLERLVRKIVAIRREYDEGLLRDNCRPVYTQYIRLLQSIDCVIDLNVSDDGELTVVLDLLQEAHVYVRIHASCSDENEAEKPDLQATFDKDWVTYATPDERELLKTAVADASAYLVRDWTAAVDHVLCCVRNVDEAVQKRKDYREEFVDYFIRKKVVVEHAEANAWIVIDFSELLGHEIERFLVTCPRDAGNKPVRVRTFVGKRPVDCSSVDVTKFPTATLYAAKIFDRLRSLLEA
jgi:hypothetical protein